MITSYCEIESIGGLEQWFLQHHEGSVPVRNKHGKVRRVDNYPDGVAWLARDEHNPTETP